MGENKKPALPSISDFKGTAGKWYTTEIDDIGIKIGANHAHYVADVFKGNRSNEEIFANAKLIATAPELLEALIETNRILGKADLNGDMLEHYGELAIRYVDNRNLINDLLGEEDGDGR